MQLYPTPMKRCPRCHEQLHGVFAVLPSGEPRPPKPGDFSVCPDCGLIIRFNDDMSLRVLTEQDQKDMSSQPESALALALTSIRVQELALERKARMN